MIELSDELEARHIQKRNERRAQIAAQLGVSEADVLLAESHATDQFQPARAIDVLDESKGI